MTLNESLARWVATLRFTDLPSELVASTRLRILDVLGCMLAGVASAEVVAAHRSAQALFPGSDTHTVGFPGPSSVIAAASVCGAAALVLEFDDSHLESAIHVTSPVLAAALPMAMAGRLDGRALIAATAVGTELACRLGVVAPGGFHRNGFHPTALFGAFGACYAAAHCQRATVEQVVAAAGICASLSAGSMASWEDGSAAKSLHAGFSACAGIQAVSLARSGVTGPLEVFDGRFGFFRAHVQDPATRLDFARVTAGLGTHWEALAVAPKVYPCGHYIQPLVDAALALMSAHGIRPDDIARIVCTLPDYLIPLVGEPVHEKRRPKTPFHGRFSLQHTMAEVLADGGLFKNSFARKNLRDPRYNGLADKVEVRALPGETSRAVLCGTVEVKLGSGARFAHTVENMRGTPANPMTVSELVRKFQANTADMLTRDRAEAVANQILTLDACDDVWPIFAEL